MGDVGPNGGSPFASAEERQQLKSVLVQPDLDQSCLSKAKEIIALYPDHRSAVMPLLYLVQEYHGFISQEGIDWTAKVLNIAPVRVLEVATFYTMYHKQPTGCYHIQLCRTLPCALRSARELSLHIQKRINDRQRSVQGRPLWSFEEVECLGSCGTAPMVQINDVFFENLDLAQMDEIMDSLEEQAVSGGAATPLELGSDLRLSTTDGHLGRGELRFKPSQVWSKCK